MPDNIDEKIRILIRGLNKRGDSDTITINNTKYKITMSSDRGIWKDGSVGLFIQRLSQGQWKPYRGISGSYAKVNPDTFRLKGADIDAERAKTAPPEAAAGEAIPISELTGEEGDIPSVVTEGMGGAETTGDLGAQIKGLKSGEELLFVSGGYYYKAFGHPTGTRVIPWVPARAGRPGQPAPGFTDAVSYTGLSALRRYTDPADEKDYREATGVSPEGTPMGDVGGGPTDGPKLRTEGGFTFVWEPPALAGGAGAWRNIGQTPISPLEKNQWESASLRLQNELLLERQAAGDVAALERQREAQEFKAGESALERKARATETLRGQQFGFLSDLIAQASGMSGAAQAAFLDVLESQGLPLRDLISSIPIPTPPPLAAVSRPLTPTEQAQGARFTPAGFTPMSVGKPFNQATTASRLAQAGVGGQQPGLPPRPTGEPDLGGLANPRVLAAAEAAGLTPWQWMVEQFGEAQARAMIEAARAGPGGPAAVPTAATTFAQAAAAAEKAENVGSVTYTAPDGTKTTVTSPAGGPGTAGKGLPIPGGAPVGPPSAATQKFGRKEGQGPIVPIRTGLTEEERQFQADL